MTALPLVAALLAGYLLGSVPFAVLIARARGVDILKEGSGNPGATNVKRVLGRGPGNLCFALDCLKGLVAALWTGPVFHDTALFGMEAATAREVLGIAGLLGAILGHSFSAFLRFRGGKGVAVTIGGLAALYTPVIAVAVLVWLAVFFTTRVVALASIALALALPVANALLALAGANSLFLRAGVPAHVLMVVLAVLIVARHHSNIRRLLVGRENRF